MTNPVVEVEFLKVIVKMILGFHSCLREKIKTLAFAKKIELF